MSSALKPFELDLDILSGQLVYVPKPNFSYKTIPEGCCAIIPQYQEMSVYNRINIFGRLSCFGNLVILGNRGNFTGVNSQLPFTSQQLTFALSQILNEGDGIDILTNQILGKVTISEETMDFTTLVDEFDENVTYIGYAQPGTLVSSPLWKIKKITTVVEDLKIEYADGNKNFDNVWNDRTTYSYS